MLICACVVLLLVQLAMLQQQRTIVSVDSASLSLFLILHPPPSSPSPSAATQQSQVREALNPILKAAAGGVDEGEGRDGKEGGGGVGLGMMEKPPLFIFTTRRGHMTRQVVSLRPC